MTAPCRLLPVIAACLALAGCVAALPPAGTAAPGLAAVPPAAEDTSVAGIIARVEPVAEEMCRARTRGVNCDIAFAVDDRPGQQPNAFQTLDGRGGPMWC